jgi:hypothetical protein
MIKKKRKVFVELECEDLARTNAGSKKLKEQFAHLDSVWSTESKLRTWATIKSLEMLEKIAKRRKDNLNKTIQKE